MTPCIENAEVNIAVLPDCPSCAEAAAAPVRFSLISPHEKQNVTIADVLAEQFRKHTEAEDRRREIEVMKILAYLTLPMVMQYDASGNVLPAQY